MSAKEPDGLHDARDHAQGEDNYEAAYAPQPEAAPGAPTPEHGYWRSLRELDGEATVQTDRSGNELPPMPTVIDPLSRRNFFHLMGASMALAGVGACRRYEKEEIVPLARRPEDQVPGQTQEYATAFELGGVGHALVATSFEGRPIRLDGNPDHPFASGPVIAGTKRHAGTSAFAQAAVLDMYDPDRSQSPLAGGKGASIDGFRAAVRELLPKLGARARVLAEATSSPTVHALRERLRARGVQWHEYEPLSHDNERVGTRLAFGQALRPLAKLDVCETIVALDCDLLVEHPASLRYSRDFARSRQLGGSLGPGKMNRLWAIESTFSHTGAMADHRLALRSDHVLAFALALDARLRSGPQPDAESVREAKAKKFLDVLAEELGANKGRAVLVAGRRQPPEVHALVARINETIGAVGTTLDYLPDLDADRPSHLQSITALAKDMATGAVDTLVILGGNPVYDAPADLDFAGALAGVKTSIHLHEYVNETSKKTSWHVPRSHFLEAWGDTRTWDGTVTIAQPLIAPLYGGLSMAELLSMLLGEETGGEQLVRQTHANAGGSWRKHVHDGFVAGPGVRPVGAARVGNFPIPALTPSQASGSKLVKSGELEVVFHYSSFTYDGRFANNAWLQETPDFLTKVTWDNYALVGPDTAKHLGLENDRMVTVSVEGRSITLPCYTIPGQAHNTIALVLGGGRTAAGRVGGQGTANRVGWDTYKVRTTKGFDIALGASAAPTGERYELASVQEHWDIRTGLIPSVNTDGLQKRLPDLIRETTGKKLLADPGWTAESKAELYWDDANVETDGPKRHFSLFREHEYHGRRWAMAIDLNTCTGCNACVVACQAENNIPVVGRQEVRNNREMSWIRIDRYFSGPPSDPVVVHQPIACHHCETAPCEQVCPVGATSHSDEGLNDMAYNRCIGTRYCANNCPYKVRRFNFLDWNKEWREARNKVRRLLFNPEVTVRMRGVMEKCTFCVQRIQNAKIHAKAEIRTHKRTGTVDGPLPDGEVVVACQQACPSECIVFGDLSDKDSRVSKLHADRRAYDLLPDVYSKPRTRFLARLRNPNPALEKPAPQQGSH